jgi:hypothetical protein
MCRTWACRTPIRKPDRNLEPGAVMKRDKTTQEVLLEPQNGHVTSLDELLNRCVPALAERLWATCRWPDSMSDGWKMGDYNFLILSIAPEADAQIYIQFWSEPHEPVLIEVSSSEWSPGTLKNVGQPQRQLLSGLGFEVGGRSRSLHKQVEISSPAQAGTVAREALQILYEAFGYRGQWPLELRHHECQRADVAPTHRSVTPQDFAKLAQGAGFQAAVASDEKPEDVRFVMLCRGPWKSVAILDGRVQDTNLYSLITLQTTLPSPVTDAAIHELNARMRFVTVSRRQERVLIQMPISLLGGVTAEWIVQALDQWVDSCRQSEATRQKSQRRAGSNWSGASERVH